MSTHNIDGITRRLEQLAGRELQQLVELGPEAYTTADLIRLRGQWEVKKELHDWLHPTIIRLLAWTPAYAALFTLFFFLNWGVLALLAVALIPLSFILAGIGWWIIQKFCGSQSHLEAVDELIEQEMDRRKGGMG